MPPMTVGLDLGNFSLKRVRLRSGLRSLEVIDAQTVPVPRDDRPRRERIAEALAALGPGQQSDLAAVSLPGDEILLRTLQLPFSDRKRIELTLGPELESQIPFGLDEVVFDYQTIYASRSGAVLLAAVSPRENLGGWLKLLTEAGVDPRLLGHDALALSSLLGWLKLEEAGQYGLLDVGHEMTSLVLVRGERVVFARTISGGGRELVELLSAAYHLQPAEVLAKLKGASIQLAAGEQTGAGADLDQLIRRAFSPLVRNLRQTLAAARQLTGEKPQRVWLSGGAAAVGGLENYFGEQLAVDMEKLPPPAISGVEKLDAGGQPGFVAYARALGLALHAHQGGRRGWLNLRRGPFAYQGNFELARGRVLQIALSILIVLVLAAGQALVRYLSLKSTAAEIDKQTQQITKAILGKTYQDLDVALAVMRDNLSPANNPLPRVTALDVLREIHQRIPQDVIFRLKEINISPKRLQLTAFTDTFEAVEKIRNELGKFECFGEIQTGKTQKSTSGNEVEFSFNIVFGC